MRVWIVATYEPLPGIDKAARLLRCGTLARELGAQGHEVTWWTSTFHHVRKANRFDESRSVDVSPGFRIELLWAPPYERNISWRRVRHNRRMAAAFATAAGRYAERPDVIFAAVPSLELAEAAVRFGRARGIPVVVDVRDRWPDLYLNAVPRPLRGVGRFVLGSEFRRAHRIFAGATGITGVSDTYRDSGLTYARRSAGPYDGVFPLGFPLPSTSDEDSARQAASFRERFSIPRDAMVFSFAGMFGSSYDLETVVAAARRLQERGEQRVRIVLAGTGDNAPKLQESAAGLSNVVFTGWLDQADGWSLLKASALGLAPYTRDALQSLPNKAFEYMAAGLPTLSSLTGELESLLRREGVGRQYVAGDPDSLADALHWFADHGEERETMGSRARALYLNRFSTPVIYPALVQHLQQVARGAVASSDTASKSRRNQGRNE